MNIAVLRVSFSIDRIRFDTSSKSLSHSADERNLTFFIDFFVQIDSDSRCSTQFFLDASSSNVFSIGSNGNLTWRNPSVGPTQGAYEIQVVLQQSCSSILIRNISTKIIVTFRNFPSSTTVATTSRSSGIDNSTIYAIIGGVAGFILIVIAILFIVLYYHIQRAKHRVPPFFKTSKSSSPKFLTFRKSKNLISSSSPLDVRDDDSSNSSSSDQTTSSPIQSRLLSQRYKVTDPPINTTIEELLSSYDNRSTSSSSSSSGPPGQIPISNHPGAFRSPLRDSHQLDTINEDRPWMSNDPRLFPLPRMIIPSEDAMDIISESHEVENKSRFSACPSIRSSSPRSSTSLITTMTTLETNPFQTNRIHLSPIGTTRC